jgi:hypothetical protein
VLEICDYNLFAKTRTSEKFKKIHLLGVYDVCNHPSSFIILLLFVTASMSFALCDLGP